MNATILTKARGEVAFQIVRSANKKGYYVNSNTWYASQGYGGWFRASDQMFPTRAKAQAWIDGHNVD